MKILSEFEQVPSSTTLIKITKEGKRFTTLNLNQCENDNKKNGLLNFSVDATFKDSKKSKIDYNSI